MSANEMSRTERVLAGRAGAHKSWAQTENRAARTQAARDAAEARFEHQVDPEGLLAPAERKRRAKSARAAFYAEIQRRAAAKRRAGREVQTNP